MTSSVDDIVLALKKLDISNEAIQVLKNQFQQTTCFICKKINKPFKITDSRLLGLPGVPKDFQWPHHENQPMYYIGQINLEQIDLGDNSFPNQGLLQFFIQPEIWPSPGRVIWQKNIESLAPAKVPDMLPLDEILDEVPIELEKVHLTIPPTNDNESLQELGLQHEDIISYEEFSENFWTLTATAVIFPPWEAGLQQDLNTEKIDNLLPLLTIDPFANEDWFQSWSWMGRRLNFAVDKSAFLQNEIKNIVCEFGES